VVDNVHIPAGGPPEVARPDPGIFEAMGQENIFRMAEDFYRELEQSSVRHMFPEDMRAASRKQGMFLTGILGGPPLYQQHIGPPRLRARHLPFAIDEEARQTWLGCFKKVLEHPERYDFPEEHLPGFIAWLEAFSAWMVNRK
jgi:hemoglobin